jgi:hypothetical protein
MRDPRGAPWEQADREARRGDRRYTDERLSHREADEGRRAGIPEPETETEQDRQANDRNDCTDDLHDNP